MPPSRKPSPRGKALTAQPRKPGPRKPAPAKSGPSKATPAKPGPRKPVPRSPRATAEMRIKWFNLGPMFDFWGQEMRRYFHMDTLTNATDKYLRERDTCIIPSVQEVLGPSPVVTLAFELFQEGRFQLIFRLRATNMKGKQAFFAFVVAKNHEECSAVASKEYNNLRILHQRSPKYVVRPFRFGKIYLPDRHGRQQHAREVFVYLTQWLGDFHELGIDRSLQFFINVKTPQLLTLTQTEELKGKIVEIIASTYDPVRRLGMEMPQVASGDFVVTKPTRGSLKIRMIACRKLIPNTMPAKLLSRLATMSWDWGGREFHLAPMETATVVKALENALGKETARDWLAQYVEAVKTKKVKSAEPLSLRDLAPYGIK